MTASEGAGSIGQQVLDVSQGIEAVVAYSCALTQPRTHAAAAQNSQLWGLVLLSTTVREGVTSKPGNHRYKPAPQ